VTDDGYFGEEIAARYDADTSGMHDQSVIETVVDVLAGLAGDGRALEFGVGTGRIAIPLARRGVDVHGIDLSRAMAARLYEKPGGAAIGVTIGDFADARVPGKFSLAYLVFNTINNLTTQDARLPASSTPPRICSGAAASSSRSASRSCDCCRRGSAPFRSTSARSSGPTTFTTAQRSR